MDIKLFLSMKRFLKAFISSGISSAFILSTDLNNYSRIFLIALITAIIQALEKLLTEIGKQKN
jgi:hypothetical protein